MIQLTEGNKTYKVKQFELGKKTTIRTFSISKGN